MRDAGRAAGLAALFFVLGALIQVDWVASHRTLTLWIIFLCGYAGIVFEDIVEFNKSGVSLLMAAALWTAIARSASSASAGATPEVLHALSAKLAEMSEIIFFLLGAMSIVEIVDAHRGFKVVTDAIRTRSKRKLLWLLSLVTFFMSAVLDNLTTTIVMVSLLRKLLDDEDDDKHSNRKLMGAAVVIAANAGGAWTPIGDVTTTMLWIGGQLSAEHTMRHLFLPAFVSLVCSLLFLTPMVREQAEARRATAAAAGASRNESMAPRGRVVFYCGLGALLFVPAFKQLTGLPPYVGMLSGLGAMWLLTDVLHAGEPARNHLRATSALRRIDQSSVLFFLGILLSVGALESAGVLHQLAAWLDATVPSRELIAAIIGLVSSVIDNVPLVAATMGMYELQQFPRDSQLWQLIAFCAGTGGSILIIGSAAGVAFMGMERVEFLWYARRVSLAALAGYVGGVATYLAMHGASLTALLGQ